MSKAVFALPVSVEQIAVTIKQMSTLEQQHLLDLVPSLRQLIFHASSRTKVQAQATVAQLREKVLSVLENQLLTPDEPFWGHLTLREYHALSDQEKAKLWEKETETDLMELEEREVQPDAVSVR